MSKSTQQYTVISESTWEISQWVHQCGAILLSAKVYHPIWDNTFLMSGSGQVQVEEVPYCPSCQKKPSPNGLPILGEL